jgi:CRISPR-associated protein Cas1
MGQQTKVIHETVTFQDLCRWGSFLRGWERVELNHGAPGADGVTVEDFSERLDTELLRLQDELLSGQYKPMHLIRVEVPKPAGGIRRLAIPTVRDRVVQSALYKLLIPWFDTTFEDESFGYRPQRSHQLAQRKVSHWRDQGYVWVVDADIEDFFNEIDRGILMSKIRALITDTSLLALIESWLECPVDEGGYLRVPDRGIAQGSPLSPLWANLYLDEFDEEIADEGFKLVRYADDFIILCKSPEKARDGLGKAECILNRLGLNLHPEKTRITSFQDGFHFLGALFVRSVVLESPKRSRQPEERFVDVLPDAIPEDPSLPHFTGEVLEEYLRGQGWEEVAFPEKEESTGRPQSEFSEYLRTLIVTEPGSVVCKDGHRLTVRRKKEIELSVPFFKIGQVLLMGYCQVTSQALAACLRKEIPITLMTSTGRYIGRWDTDNHDLLWERLQWQKMGSTEFALNFARAVVKAKIHNQRCLLRRALKRGKSTTLESTSESLLRLEHQAEGAEDLPKLRGYEGAATRAYFRALATLFDTKWQFERRVKRPAPDPINSLLSFGYSLLFQNIYSIVMAHGLNPNLGHLHDPRPGHPALVSDLQEEFRTPIVDSLILYLVNRGDILSSDFTYGKDGSPPCLLKPEARKLFVHGFEKKISRLVKHPRTGHQVGYRRCIDMQVQTYRRMLRGDIKEYIPFLLKLR